MRAPQPDTSPDSPAVEAFRKKARGEPLTDAEEALLQSTTRKPKGPGIPTRRSSRCSKSADAASGGMIGPFEVVWSDKATDDWMRLSFADAEAVARAVRRWTETGRGVVIAVEGE